jgi:hypothetical protein
MFNTNFGNQPNVNNLPVSAQEVNQQFHCPGAPYQLPFKNAFPDIVNGYVVKMLQDGAFKNALRVFLFNMASQNGYQNELYNMLVSSATQLAEAFAATTQGNSQEQLVLNAAKEVTDCATAMMATQYPVLQQMMGPGIEVELNRLLARHQDIGRLVASVQQRQQPQQAFGGFPQQQQQGFPQSNFPQQGSFAQAQFGGRVAPQPAANPNINWGRYAGTASSIQAQNTFNPVEGGFKGRGGLSATPALPAPVQEPVQQPAASTNTFGTQWGGRSSTDWPKRATAPGNPAGVVEEMFQDMGNPTMPIENAQQRAFAESLARQQQQQPAKPTPEPYIEPEPVATQSPNGVANHDTIDESRPYDVVKLDNGVEIRPAHLSGWTRTWSIESPWPMAFDPNTHMKFHVRTPQADGTFTVKEVVKAISPQEMEQMEYLKHEIKNRVPYVLDPTKVVMPVDWEEVATLDAPQVTLVDDGDSIPVENPEVKIIPDELVAHSFEEAEIKYLNEVIEVGSENFDGKVREYYYRNVKPVNVDGNMIGVMIELSKKQTLSAVAKFLREHHENEEITPRLYNLLVKDLTARVNEALSVNLGYGKRCLIDDFVLDIDDLGNELHKDAMGLLWSLLNTERASDILNSVTNILKGEEYWEYLNKLGHNLNKEHKGEVMQVLARYELNSVTHLPWTLELYATDEVQTLKASENPAVHKAMIALLARTGKKATKFSRHYIVDVNHRVLEIMPGYLGSNSVLIRAAQL